MGSILVTVILVVLITGLLPLESSAFKVNSTYTFTNLLDRTVITVHKNGMVTTEADANSPEQRWTVVNHPTNAEALEFKQAVVPYNELSGFQNRPDNPGIFPRPLGLKDRGVQNNVQAWSITIRNRWCLKGLGIGLPLDRDDCEESSQPPPLWEFWELKEVS